MEWKTATRRPPGKETWKELERKRRAFKSEEKLERKTKNKKTKMKNKGNGIRKATDLEPEASTHYCSHENFCASHKNVKNSKYSTNISKREKKIISRGFSELTPKSFSGKKNENSVIRLIFPAAPVLMNSFDIQISADRSLASSLAIHTTKTRSAE